MLKKKLQLFLLGTMIFSVFMPSLGEAGNVKKSYINLAKDAEQATSSDIPNGYGNISTALNNVVYDFSSSMVNGTANNVKWDEPPAGFKKSLTFNGTSGYVDFGNSALLKPTNKITVETWAKFNTSNLTTNYTRFISDWHQTTTTDRWVFHIVAQNTVRWLVCNVNETKVSYVDYVITPGQWYHLAGVYDGANVVFYVNGKNVGSSPLTGTLNTNNATVRLGTQQETGGTLNGSISEVRIWSVARTPEQISDNMNKPLVGKQEGLVSYWSMNQ